MVYGHEKTSWLAISFVNSMANGIIIKLHIRMPHYIIIVCMFDCGGRFDDWTKTYSNCKYAFEITTPSGSLAYIDGYGVGIYIIYHTALLVCIIDVLLPFINHNGIIIIGGAAKIANDASGAIRVPVCQSIHPLILYFEC